MNPFSSLTNRIFVATALLAVLSIGVAIYIVNRAVNRQGAAELQRGICRAFRTLGHSVITELPLANGRRADVVALWGAAMC